MPSLHSAPDRHVVIDRRPGQYLCFPDVCLADDGTLVCVYNEFDRHVGTRRRLLMQTSRDQGRTWGGLRCINANDSHCPRLSRLSDGTLVMADDATPALYWSLDNGEHWTQQPGSGLGHGLLDRVLELSPETLFTTGHFHRGAQPQSKIRQAPSEQMAYVSRNRGRHWQLNSIVASEKCLVLCEASTIRLPGEGKAGRPRLLALMRENSFVGEPMYCCISEDGGDSWGEPMPTPLIGHRPTLGWTRSGRLLVTYRDVGPDPGAKAWLGGLDELCSDFAVHGLHPKPGCAKLTKQGLHVKCDGGLQTAVRYGLRPISDPEHARAAFSAEVNVRSAGTNGCGVRLGIWWKLFPEGVVPDVDGAALVPWAGKGPFHTLGIAYEPGVLRLTVDGAPGGEYPVDRMAGETRPILVGAVARTTDNACDVLWRRMELAISEPRLGRVYDWDWEAASGKTPDAWTEARVLELRNARSAAPMDFGYSGWVELEPGRFFCVYHHADGDEPDYREGLSAHVAGTWFGEDDFQNAVSLK
jgi:hypothetical protein